MVGNSPLVLGDDKIFRVYLALIQKAESESADYGVCFPDFPGCVFGIKSCKKYYRMHRKIFCFVKVSTAC